MVRTRYGGVAIAFLRALLLLLRAAGSGFVKFEVEEALLESLSWALDGQTRVQTRFAPGRKGEVPLTSECSHGEHKTASWILEASRFGDTFYRRPALGCKRGTGGKVKNEKSHKCMAGNQMTPS